MCCSVTLVRQIYFFADPRTNEYLTKPGLLVTTIEYFDLILSIPPTYLWFQLKVLCLIFVSPSQDYKEGMMVMCVELVANRFLRKVIQQAMM